MTFNFFVVNIVISGLHSYAGPESPTAASGTHRPVTSARNECRLASTRRGQVAARSPVVRVCRSTLETYFPTAGAHGDHKQAGPRCLGWSFPRPSVPNFSLAPRVAQAGRRSAAETQRVDTIVGSVSPTRPRNAPADWAPRNSGTNAADAVFWRSDSRRLRRNRRVTASWPDRVDALEVSTRPLPCRDMVMPDVQGGLRPLVGARRQEAGCRR